MELCNEVAAILPCSLIFSNTSDPHTDNATTNMDSATPWNIMEETQGRFYILALPKLKTQGWLRTQPRIPLSIDEIKEGVHCRFEMDEAKFVALLERCASVSYSIFRAFRITRTLIRDVLDALGHNRAIQVTFRSIICATRFKYFHQGNLLPTLCQKCGAIDSFQHLLHCTEMNNIPPYAGATNSEELISFLV